MSKPRSAWAPVLPVPETAPPAKVRHTVRGEPLRVFSYRDADGALLGHVCRFLASDGSPLHIPLTWCRNHEDERAWRWIQFAPMRPLFGLDRLGAAQSDDHVLMAFDENAADAARELLPFLVGVSWPGGPRGMDQVDFSPLRGRTVWIWPALTRARHAVRRDTPAHAADAPLLPRARQPGWLAALKLERVLLGYGCTVIGIADPWSDPAQPDGFDLAQALQREWSPDAARDWLIGHMQRGEGTQFDQAVRRLRGEPATPAATVAAALPSLPAVPQSWEYALMHKHGELMPCLANVHDILRHAPEWQGVLGFDEFSSRVWKLRPSPWDGAQIGEWDAADDSRCAMWITRAYGIAPASATVAEAVEVLARGAPYHPVRQWLRRQQWDGTPRLDDWMADYIGVEKTAYTILVGRWWLLGAVARVMDPGCKFDFCLVLEGLQGKGKSTALAILGGEWFGDTDLDLGNKDSMSALRGKWVYEFAELGSLTRAEETKQKSFLSRRVDEYRPVYGRREISVPRQTVFAGSTNTWEWNKDPTGGRRFWPVDCAGDFHLDGLREVRAQLFAEALHRFEAGERFHPTEEEQRTLFDPEQLRREQQESLVDALHDWVYLQYKDFSISAAIIDGLDLDASKLTRDLQTRVGIALRKLGCQRVERRNGTVRFWYKPPQRNNNLANTSQPAQLHQDGDHVPF
jgi:predicted P-loop ATPase